MEVKVENFWWQIFSKILTLKPLEVLQTSVKSSLNPKKIKNLLSKSTTSPRSSFIHTTFNIIFANTEISRQSVNQSH